MLSRRSLLHGAVVAPFAGLVKLPDFHDDDGFEPFDYSVGGTPYISCIKDDPPEQVTINKFYWPGVLTIVCSCRHKSSVCDILEHQTWECLYSHKEAEKIEIALSGYMASEKWFARKLYVTAKEPLLSTKQYVPEFSWGNNPIKLKLCSIEYCGIDKESGRLL